MNSIKCVENYLDVNKKVRRGVIFGAATAGVAAGAYIGIKKLTQLIEDKRLEKYYEDEIEEIFKEKERIKFYENEFIREEEEEKEELEKAVEEFNSRRLKREECPICKDKK